ncbi:hypothetical protein ACHWQZ_G016821 [Mnemiopsis leidyi]
MMKTSTAVLFFLLLYAGKPTEHLEDCTVSTEETRDRFEITSNESGRYDDDNTTVSCPEGYFIVDCTLVQGEILLSSDGVWVNKDSCSGYKAGGDIAGDERVKVKVTCQRSNIQKVVYTMKKVVYNRGDTKVAELVCPSERYEMKSCFFYSPWRGIESPNDLITKTGKITVVQNKCALTITSIRNFTDQRSFTLSAICKDIGTRALLKVEMAAADSGGRPDSLDRVVESNLVVTDDALEVVRRTAVKVTCQRSNIQKVVYVTETVTYNEGDTKKAELVCPSERYKMESCLFYSPWRTIERPNGLDVYTGKIIISKDKCLITIDSTSLEKKEKWGGCTIQVEYETKKKPKYHNNTS